MLNDDLFLWTVGLAVLAAQQLYGLIGWACPILVDKK